ncbi:NADPH-dependent F420 reductase [Cupriavidus gilardii]|uniref:NADPH-dependent F420 reductase n=1 Tax=Cupriavidus gilardii TaxID=82541 RepID=UPI003CC7E2E9
MAGGAMLLPAAWPGLASAQSPSASPSPSPSPSPQQSVPRPSGSKPMQIGVIGSGRIGGTVGGLWVKAGYPVLFSSRHPEQLKPLVDGLGPLARAGTVAEAVAFGDVLFVAVPYGALPEIGKEHGRAMAGKVVLDATNAYRHRDGAAGEEALANGIGATTAKYLPGTRIVRAFNFTSANDFATRHHQEPRIAIPIAGDDRAALDTASDLVRAAGFEPVVVGPLKIADSFAPGGPLFRQVGSAEDLRQKARAAVPAEPAGR